MIAVLYAQWLLLPYHYKTFLNKFICHHRNILVLYRIQQIVSCIAYIAIAKKELARKNQNPEDELRREAPQLIFWVLFLSKPCFAITYSSLQFGHYIFLY